MTKWVKCSERLPEDESNQLILYNTVCKSCKNHNELINDRRYGIGWYSDDGENSGWFLIEPHTDIDIWLLEDENKYDVYVTHWIPLPEAPKE